MTAIMSLLTFLSVLSLGVALAIGTGVMRWNTGWDLYATVQIMPGDNAAETMRIIDANSAAITAVSEITTEEMERMLRPWMAGGGGLGDYLPQMFELRFRSPGELRTIGSQIENHARFLAHSAALQSSINTGWRMVFLAALVLALVLASIGVCISYIARNTALLHKRELEILNQIGANDLFVARQMQIIVAKICAVAGVIGFIGAALVLLLILATAASARVGLMAMMGLSPLSWLALALTPIVILIFSVWITKRTTIGLLKS